jgi:glycogen debranching enzyme
MSNFHGWEKERFDSAVGLFWQEDGNDGMEVSIGGNGFRAPLNSYLIGEAASIATIARMAGDEKLAQEFEAKSDQVRRRMESVLWDDTAKFFKVLPRTAGAKLTDVRELHGYSPWFSFLPEARFDVAWAQLMDPKGFFAPFGPTTAEQRHPRFAVAYLGHECQWNGPSWPYSTAITLTALANLLNARPAAEPGPQGFFDTLKIYGLMKT